MCRLQRSELGKPEKQLSFTTYRYISGQYNKEFPIFIHGWFLRIQSDLDGPIRQGEDYFCYHMGNLLLKSHAIRSEKCWGNLPKSYGDVIPRHDAQKN